MTRAPPKSASRRWWRGVYGSITPSQGVPGATEGATGAWARRGGRTIGRSREARRAASPGPKARDAGGQRMEPPILGVLVLAPALGAHREAGHRRQRPVVRDADDDREARSALRAVDERVAVAAILGVEELPEA